MSWRRGRRPNRKQWRRARLAILDAANWTCRECGGYGNQVDHVIPIDRLAADADLCALGNLQCLCASCHWRKTRQENGGAARADSEEWRVFLAGRMEAS